MTQDKAKDTSSKTKKKTGGYSKCSIFMVILALLLGVLQMQGTCIPALVFAGLLNLKTGAQGFFGLSLITSEPINAAINSDYVELGYVRSLKFKFIYVMRFIMKDNFLFQSWLKTLQDELLVDLKARNAPHGNATTYKIPTFEFKDMDPMVFFRDYVTQGKPCILKNTPIKAMKWTTEVLAQKAGNFRTNMRCMDGSVQNYTLKQYVDSRNGDRACYFDNNANIFEEYPELEEELEMNKFYVHMSGANNNKNYLFSQMFMSVFDTTGALFHCANYNNLFFMIQGRKKWTFIDPSNSFLMYPFFNDMFKDSKSWLTWFITHHPNAQQLIDTHFPLFNYAPKYVAILEPGDILINPTWNWHEVENIDKDSIGIASRWLIPQIYPYSNSLFSFLQFMSSEFRTFLYRRIAQKFFGRGEFIYTPTAHGNVDFNINFNRTGSIYSKRHEIRELFADSQWELYEEYLKSVGYPVDEK